MKFELNSPNQLLLNTRNSQDESGVLLNLQREFENQYGNNGYFLIASSGSSKKQNESVKLIALSIQSVLNSAQRFVEYFGAGRGDNWGLVLPEFHVAGLGVYARAYLTGSSVFRKDWSDKGLVDWIIENQIVFISLVPAQVFDLVQNKVIAPAGLKKVFVGAGSLNEEIKKQVMALGWPVVETYGMTETCSMIAVNESERLQVMPGVEVKSNDGLLSIKCNSLLTASIQKQGNQTVITALSSDWYDTEDNVDISGDAKIIKFLGRADDYIKILGEGVSLKLLRDQLAQIALTQNIHSDKIALLSVVDARKENELVLAVENSVAIEKIDTILNLFNQQCRPFEKISLRVFLKQIPRTELGKLKTEELKRIVTTELNRGANG
ncbi:AMP-binding protein [bacterium]|nr:AMP-binding protein [bacterium]